jgi:pimeloyl-ACP methyl ester carboxylesterase
MKKRIIRILIAIAVLTVLVFLVGVGFVYLAPEKTTRVLIDLERQRSGLVKREIELPGALRYAYLEGGQGEPLVLLHGFGGNKDNFTRVARFLTPHFRVIIPDHIGFGDSSHPETADYSPTAQAANLHSLFEALGIREVHLGGNSMGGQIAMTYAAVHPAEVKSLWLLAPAGVWSAPASEVRRIISETGHNPLIVRTEDEFAALFSLLMSEPPYLPRPVMDVLAKERIQNAELETRIFEHLVADSLEERIRGLATPTLMVFGDQDRAIHPGTSDILHELLPGSQVVILKGIGHVPMLERPKQAADDYLRFKASL